MNITPPLLALMILAAPAFATDSPAPAASTAPADTSSDLLQHDKVEAVFSRMSPEDKIAELTAVTPADLMEDGKLSSKKCRERIPNGIGHVGSFANRLSKSPEEIREMVRDIQRFLMTETPARIPAVFHDEMISGFAGRSCTLYPQHIGVGCSWNPGLVELCARQTAETSRKQGGTLALSPMIDVTSDPGWERMEEGFGEDPYLTARLGLAFVKGLQGEDLSQGVGITLKHFAGYGNNPKNDAEIYEDLLTPHEVGISLGGATCVMPNYGKFKGNPSHSSPELLHTILRDYLGFTGPVLSDYGAVHNQVLHGFAKTDAEAAAKALNSGVDVEFPDGRCFRNLPEDQKAGLVNQERIDEAVRRSLTLKAKLGLLDDKPKILTDGPLDADPAEHRKTAYNAACQSVVLLKNNGILPLGRHAKIALVGPNADSFWSLCGDYSPQSLGGFWFGVIPDPNSPKLITLREGLKSRLGPEANLEYEIGCDWDDALKVRIDKEAGDPRLKNIRVQRMIDIVHQGVPKPYLEKALHIAAQSDIIIAAMGENVYLCGEARRRNTLRLPGDQEAFVKKLLDTGKPVVLVTFGGHNMVIDTLESRCAAIIQAWYPGEEGGHALADILLGNVNPSGKLCVSYPGTDKTELLSYRDGYASAPTPLYPFGHGLSYTTFGYGHLILPNKADIQAESIPVSFKVRNSGTRAGTEITQLYLSPVDSNLPMKAMQLKGFNRVELAPGEEKTLSLNLSPELFSFWKDGSWRIEPGNYKIRIGGSSASTPLQGKIELMGAPHTFPKRKVFFSTNKTP